MVHDVWLTMFNLCYKTVFFSINFKIKRGMLECHVTSLPLFGGNTGLYVYFINGVHVSCGILLFLNPG